MHITRANSAITAALDAYDSSTGSKGNKDLPAFDSHNDFHSGDNDANDGASLMVSMSNTTKSSGSYNMVMD